MKAKLAIDEARGVMFGTWDIAHSPLCFYSNSLCLLVVSWNAAVVCSALRHDLFSVTQ